MQLYTNPGGVLGWSQYLISGSSFPFLQVLHHMKLPPFLNQLTSHCFPLTIFISRLEDWIDASKLFNVL